MPAHRMNMRMIKDVLRLKLDANFSHEQIAASLGISKGVVTKYVGLAAAAGLDWATPARWTKPNLSGGCWAAHRTSAYVQPDYGRIHQSCAARA